MKADDNISLTILTPESILLEKKVSKVSLPGSKGPFMVLKNHEPLISSLEEGDIVFESAGVVEHIYVENGFVEVLNNKVTICADI